MQEKALVAHLELHKKVVKNAWILSYEGRKVLVIEFQETVTEDKSIAYIFALAKSLVSGKGSGCTDKTVCRHRNQHFRSSGKFIRSKYEKCGKYNKNIDSTPQKKR